MNRAGRNIEESSRAPSGRAVDWVTGWIPIAVAIVATVGGICLVLSAPLDGDGRNNLGSALLSAALIGASLLWIERYIDHLAHAREEERSTSRREGFVEAAKLALSVLVIGYVEQFIQFMMNSDAQPDSRAKPSGWRGQEDRRLIVRGLMWAAELPRRDRGWWKEPGTTTAVDVIFMVATDIAERSLMDLSDIDSARLGKITDRALSHLNAAAARLSEAGDPYRALELDIMVDALYGDDVHAELPDFGGWGTENYDEMIVAGGGFEHIRQLFGYCTDRLRGASVPAGTDDVEHASNSEKAFRRWGEVVGADPSVEDLWESRFTEGSWLRGILDRATVELRESFGLPTP